MDDRTTDPPPVDASAPQPPVPRIGEDGKPVYDQEFFLALARCGREVWNRWCESKLDVAITFRETDFREPHNSIDFAEFRFGNEANFSGATFGDGINFSNASFGNGVNFSGTVFGDSANFSGAKFGESANLIGAIFGEYANLIGTKFGRYATLRAAIFGFHSSFSNAEFGDRANLFSTMLHFVSFFSGTKFRGDVSFGAARREFWPTLRSTLIRSWPQHWQERYNTHCATMHEQGAAHDILNNIKFDNTEFEGLAYFDRRRFIGECTFANARFNNPPRFEECEGGSNIDFYGIVIRFSTFTISRPFSKWTTKGQIGLRLRAIRRFAEDIKNHDLERDLYIEERRAERGILLAQYWRGRWRSLHKPKLYNHCLWIAVMAAYSLLADYGRSFVRPLIALTVSVPLFWSAYAATLIPPTESNKFADFRRATWAFAISNAVPFVGALTLERDVKLTLLCGDRPIDAQHPRPGEPVCVPIPGRCFQLLALGQSIFSALCIFFAGLALRNYFKLR